MTIAIDPDPIAILLDEHEVAMALFGDLDRALAAAGEAAPAEREQTLTLARRTLDFLNAELEVHIRKEEEPLFPRLKAVLPADDRLVDEMIAEHDHIRMKREQVRAVLDEMLSGGDHAEFRARRSAFDAAVSSAEDGPEVSAEALRSLRRSWRAAFETLRVHFQNEEEIAFPLARDLIAAEELAAAGREMVAIEEEQGMNAPVQVTAIEETAAELLRSEPLTREGRTARTLVKDGPLRLVLVAIGAGGSVQEHQAPGPTTIQAVAGRVTVAAGGEEHDLDRGAVLVLPAGMRHALRAGEPSAVLVTIVSDGR
jgi:quercetin dioxygenase-like cupin family protein/hemerythrin-like domain-containing protein